MVLAWLSIRLLKLWKGMEGNRTKGKLDLNKSLEKASTCPRSQLSTGLRLGSWKKAPSQMKL